MHHTFERPRGALRLCRRANAKIGNDCLKAAGDIAQAVRLCLQPFQRFFVNPPERTHLARDGVLESLDTLVQFGGIGGLSGALRVTPLMKREAETIQLRLEARETLLKTWIVLVHQGVARMIHKPIAK
jgi:hypothetical protein